MSSGESLKIAIRDLGFSIVSLQHIAGLLEISNGESRSLPLRYLITEIASLRCIEEDLLAAGKRSDLLAAGKSAEGPVNYKEETERSALEKEWDNFLSEEDNMWNRRMREHTKNEGSGAPDKHEHTKNEGSGAPDKHDEADALPINALTRLSHDSQAQVLYKLYLEAVQTVKNSLGAAYDAKEHEGLVNETSDKLLNIWMKNN